MKSQRDNWKNKRKYGQISRIEGIIVRKREEQAYQKKHLEIQCCTSQNSKRSFSTHPINPLLLSVGGTCEYDRISCPGINYIRWEREGIVAYVIRVLNQFIVSQSKGRLSWMGLTYSSEPFERGFHVREIFPAGFKDSYVVNCPRRVLPQSASTG